jgi:N-acetylglucosaminyldiphosphoundecaprenol N-acetyl-beta-D-mannosaminyltransferase
VVRTDSAAQPKAPRRVRVLGCPVDSVSMQEAAARLAELVETARSGGGRGAGLVVTLNPEMVMRARRDPEFRAILERAALLVPDGIGIVRAMRRRGVLWAERVGGADLLEAYLPQAVRLGHRIALAGAAPGVAEAARAELQRRHPGVAVVAADAGGPDAATAERLRRARPEMVWAAYGHGRQERFIDRHLAGIGAAAGVGVGGTLDYLAGRARRAPQPLRRAGLEWAWRLAMQPWRLRRQLVLPQFWLLERLEAAATASGRTRRGQPR